LVRFRKADCQACPSRHEKSIRISWIDLFWKA
jgi:hypothetical protein